jgi:hypothetical protein
MFWFLPFQLIVFDSHDNTIFTFLSLLFILIIIIFNKFTFGVNNFLWAMPFIIHRCRFYGMNLIKK